MQDMGLQGEETTQTGKTQTQTQTGAPQSLSPEEEYYAGIASLVHQRQGQILDLQQQLSALLDEHVRLRSDLEPGVPGRAYTYEAFKAMRARTAELEEQMNSLRRQIDEATKEVETERAKLAGIFWADCVTSPPVRVGGHVVRVSGKKIQVKAKEEHESGTGNWV